MRNSSISGKPRGEKTLDKQEFPRGISLGPRRIRVPKQDQPREPEISRRLLQEALELEVQQYIERFQQLKSESGQGLVVRNGYHQERELVTGAAP